MEYKEGDIIIFRNGVRNPTLLQGTIDNIEGNVIDMVQVKTMVGVPQENKWCYLDQVVGKQPTLNI